MSLCTYFRCLGAALISRLYPANSFHDRGHRASVAGFILFGQQWRNGIMSKTIRMGDQPTTATVHFTGTDGAEHKLYSIPSWSVTGGAVSATPSADGLTCQMAPLTPGDVTITVTVEADPTPGVNTVTATASLTVADAEDTAGTISFT